MKNIFLSMIMMSTVMYADFIRDNSTKIVTDNTTNLQWQDDAVGTTMNWESAISHCEALTLGGYDDWRLPNFNELYGIADRSRYNPAIDPVFTAVSTTNRYWSSTTYASNTSSAWVVYFSNGDDRNGNKANSHYVRCVRVGQ